MITIVGLGVNEGDLTKSGEKAILSDGKVILKSEKTLSAKSVVGLGVPYITLDRMFEKSRSFDTLNKNLVKEVLKEAKDGDVVYCVDGAASEDLSAKELLKRKNVRVINGVSKIEAIASISKISSVSYAAYSAYDISSYKRRALPLIVYDISDAFIAGDVKLALFNLVGEETKIKFVRGDKVKEIPLYELDRQGEYGNLCAAVIEERDLTERERFDMEDLHDIIVRLRRPDGCPWDKVQTHESIRINLIEEAYELVDAINKKDDEKIREECGDVILQAVFHSVLREEASAFNLDDVLTDECKKLIFRHSHIFGKDKATDEKSALEIWNKNKMKEKHMTTFSESVNDVPKNFPALMQAQKVSKRMAKGGWNFIDKDSVIKKLNEEIEELKSAADKDVADEAGDVLMTAVQLLRLYNVDCEQALLDVIEKVKKRYTAWEKLVLTDGKDVNNLSDEDWLFYYNKAKDEVKNA